MAAQSSGSGAASAPPGAGWTPPSPLAGAKRRARLASFGPIASSAPWCSTYRRYIVPHSSFRRVRAVIMRPTLPSSSWMGGRRKLEGKTKSTSACWAPCAKGSGDKTAATPRKAMNAGATRPFIHAGAVPARACAR
eukprot:9258674-Lingulodinium_polyedra.AAC.1